MAPVLNTASWSTFTVLVSRLTSTLYTPSTLSSSLLTAFSQCSQLMPGTWNRCSVMDMDNPPAGDRERRQRRPNRFLSLVYGSGPVVPGSIAIHPADHLLQRRLLDRDVAQLADRRQPSHGAA